LGHFLILKLVIKRARETLHNEICHTSNGTITTKEEEGINQIPIQVSRRKESLV
jgi:hypothetical protein